MHEYSVAAELIAAVLPHAESVSGRIVAVVLRKGELRILSNHALKEAFSIASTGTLLEGTNLRIEQVPAAVHCLHCGFRGRPETLSDPRFHFAVPVLSCPQCGEDVEITAGRELLIDRVTVDEDKEAAIPEGGSPDA
ncbi:hydrogenase maturation nickel metallochaperone HypA [Candidatus Bipolaricaulota bacterium]|nr:hydrogenase maturation nickel metallochaperone HypA [Candidatus Bipolaricaulota bacterium]